MREVGGEDEKGRGLIGEARDKVTKGARRHRNDWGRHELAHVVPRRCATLP